MHPALLKAYTTITTWRMAALHDQRSDRGEGIVSVAIAVLIMAALGVVAYAGFDAIFESTTDAAETEIGRIGE